MFVLHAINRKKTWSAGKLQCLGEYSILELLTSAGTLWFWPSEWNCSHAKHDSSRFYIFGGELSPKMAIQSCSTCKWTPGNQPKIVKTAKKKIKSEYNRSGLKCCITAEFRRQKLGLKITPDAAAATHASILSPRLYVSLVRSSRRCQTDVKSRWLIWPRLGPAWFQWIISALYLGDIFPPLISHFVRVPEWCFGPVITARPLARHRDKQRNKPARSRPSTLHCFCWDQVWDETEFKG